MKGQWSKLFIVTVAFLLIAGACVPAATPPPTPTPVPPTPTPDPAAPVKAWVVALNSGDVDGALAPFTDDVRFSVFEYYASNKDGLRGIFDWLAGLETKYQITECQTKEDRVVCTMPVSDACIAGYDPVDGLMTTMTFVPTQGGKIAQVNGYLDGFDDYYAKWISPAMTWMRANRAAELAKVESASDGREAGAINAKLCKEYGATLKAAATATAEPAASKAPGKVELKKGEITSRALAGNLLGDPTTRAYHVLLPPSYATSDKRYPVVYVLHNFGEPATGTIESIRQAYEDALQSGDAQEMIFVFPDAGNKLWGSLYLSSPTIGDYQTYLTKELVETIDATYRAIPDRASRGVTGCGMGGNGAMGLALKYPDVYGVAAPASGLYDWEHDPFFDFATNSVLRLPSNLTDLQEGNWAAVWFLAAAAAAAPNPANAPFYADIPFTRVDSKTQIVAEVRNKMAKADPVHDIQKYLAQPERLNALLLYHCTLDNDYGVSTEAARDFDKLLTTQGIEHEYLETKSGSMCTGYQSPAVKFMSDHLAGE